MDASLALTLLYPAIPTWAITQILSLSPFLSGRIDLTFGFCVKFVLRIQIQVCFTELRIKHLRLVDFFQSGPVET
jgi:hypothetical protein